MKKQYFHIQINKQKIIILTYTAKSLNKQNNKLINFKLIRFKNITIPEDSFFFAIYKKIIHKSDNGVASLHFAIISHHNSKTIITTHQSDVISATIIYKSNDS